MHSASMFLVTLPDPHELDPDSDEYPVIQVMDVIKARILRGDWGERSRMPTINEFQKEFGFARGTIVTALQNLRSEHWVKSKPGRGYWVDPGHPPAGES